MPIGQPGSPSTIAAASSSIVRHPLLGLGERHGDGLLAQTVLGVEIGGEPGRLVGVVAEAELERQARVLHPAGGVDARSDREGDVGPPRRQRRPRGLAERAQPGEIRHARQSVADDHPVLAPQRHHVGDRAQRGQPERCVGAAARARRRSPRAPGRA